MESKTIFAAFQPGRGSTLVAAGGMSTAAVLAATHHFGRGAGHSPAKPMEGEHPAHREGRQWCAGVVRRSTARSCQTKMVSHKEFRSHLQSTWFSICQGRLRSLALSLRALLRQSNGYSGVCWSRAKPNSTQLFYHHRKSNL